MRQRQDSEPALRLLLAQRRRYSKAKRWLNLKWLGMVLIALSAPLVSIIWPGLAVTAGAVTGAWIFVGRTVVTKVHQAGTSAAASIQERFDQVVFGMPVAVSRSTMPLDEEIADLVGPQSKFDAALTEERLRRWYDFEDPDPMRAVAIAQRSNLAYSTSLLNTTAKTWVALTLGWVLVLTVVSAVASLSIEEFLVGVLFPVLPAGLDVVEYVIGVRRESRQRADVARAIEDRLRAGGTPFTSDELLVWQDNLFYFRSATAYVPDLVYRLKRRRNEQQMHATVNHLSN